MKPIFFVLLLFPYLSIAQDCTPTRYRQIMREANEATFGKKPDYELAVNKLISAKTCQPDSETVVNRQLVKVFGEVNRQRELAVKNEKEANKQRELAINNEKEAKKQRDIAEKRSRNSNNLALAATNPNKTLAINVLNYNMTAHHKESHSSLFASYEIINDSISGFFALDIVAHKSGVKNMVYSPVHNVFISIAIENEPVRIWNASDGRLKSEFNAHQGKVNCLAISPDGQKIVTGGSDRSMKLWNISDTSKPVWQQTETGMQTISVDFSYDGKKIVTGTESTQLKGKAAAKIWQAENGNLFRSFPHTQKVTSVAFSPNGKKIITGCGGASVIRELQKAGEKYSIFIWDINQNSKAIEVFTEHEGIINAVSMSDDARYVVSASSDRTARIWEASTQKEVGRFTNHKMGVNSAVISPDARFLVTAGSDKKAIVCDMVSGQIVKILSGHIGVVSKAFFSPDSKRVFTASADGTIKAWNLAAGKPLIKTFKGHDKLVDLVAFSPDGKRIATGGFDIVAHLWNLQKDGQVIELKGHIKKITCLSFSPDNKTVATGSDDKTIKLWDITSGQLLKTIEGHPFPPTDLKFSRDGKKIATGSGDKIARIWDVSSGKELQKFSGSNTILQLAFSPDQENLITLQSDQTVLVWEIKTGKKKLEFKPSAPFNIGGLLSGDGKFMFAANASRDTLVQWNVSNGKQVQLFLMDNQYVQSLDVTTDGKLLALAYTDNHAALFDMETGSQLRMFGDSRKWAPTRSNNMNTIGFVTPKSGRVKPIEINESSGHTQSVEAVVFSPDGNFLLTGSSDLTAKLWCVGLDCPTKEVSQYTISQLRSASVQLEPVDLLTIWGQGEVLNEEELRLIDKPKNKKK